MKIVWLSKLICIACIVSASMAYAQNDRKPKTVFITASSQIEEKAQKDFFFAQFSLSMPLRSNPVQNDINYYYYDEDSPTVFDYILPDGLNVNYGMGIHYKSWIGLSANAGVDWVASEKLVTAPLFASLYFSPKIWDETNVFLQGSYGYAFALGRGSLGGDYIKARIGFGNDEAGFYIEVNGYDLPLHGESAIGRFCIGITVTDFEL